MNEKEEQRRQEIERHLSAISAANQPAARAFVQLKEGQGKRANTRKHYALWLSKLDDHLNGRPYTSVAEEDATGFLSALRLVGYGHGTVKGAGTCVKAALCWTLGVERLPLRLRQTLTVDRNRHIDQRPPVPDDDFAAFLKALPTLQDQAFAALLWESGFRISEALALNIESFDFKENGSVWVTLPKDGYDLKTGPRSVHVPLHANLIHGWLQVHPQRHDPKAPAWVGDGKGNKGQRADRCRFDNRWKRAFALTGIRRFTPHDLRHTAATRDAEAGYQELDLQAKYGWAPRSEMPSHYVRQRRAHQEEIARRSVGVGQDGMPLSATRMTEDQVEKRVRAALRRLLAEDEKDAGSG